MKRAQIIGITSAVIVLLVIGGFVVWASSSNNGTIEQAAPGKAAVRGPSILNYQSPYINFSYSSVYQVGHNAEAGVSIEASMLSADTNYQKHLAVTVNRLDATGLDGFSSYVVRKIQPTLYVRTDTTVDGNPATIFTKSDGREVTVYLTHAKLMTTLSWSTDSASDNLTAEARAVLSSFHWRA